MRYYLYLSATKIEMLHSQLAKTNFAKLKAGFKLKIGLAEASIEGETSPGQLGTKAEAVRNALIYNETVGSLDAPKEYIDDVASLAFGEVREYASSIAFFGGLVDGRKVALLGAASSLVGAAPTAEANHAPFYYTLKFINDALAQDADLTDDLPYAKSLERAVDVAQAAIRLPPMRLAFTAKVLHVSKRLLVATPIFVAHVP